MRTAKPTLGNEALGDKPLLRTRTSKGRFAGFSHTEYMRAYRSTEIGRAKTKWAARAEKWALKELRRRHYEEYREILAAYGTEKELRRRHYEEYREILAAYGTEVEPSPQGPGTGKRLCYDAR